MEGMEAQATCGGNSEMNERKLIESLKASHPIREGSAPREITPDQQRAANAIGKLLNHAHKRGKRKAGKWL